MELTLFWTDFFQRELEKVYEFYRGKAGVLIAKNSLA